MTTILEARQVRYDERTDTREYNGLAEDEVGVAALQDDLDDGRARVETGLQGWAPYNATLYSEEWGVFHVLVC